MRYREERAYRIELHLSADFGESYEGDEDGYAWHARFEEKVLPKLKRVVMEALASDRGWRITESPRGESDVLSIDVERIVVR